MLDDKPHVSGVSELRGMAMSTQLATGSALDAIDPALDDPAVRAALEKSALINTLALEQISISFDPTAGAILARIYDRGHATCEDLADWLESPEEWIAFSRLQRARLLYDSGTEFTVSPFGRRLIHRILNGDSVG